MPTQRGVKLDPIYTTEYVFLIYGKRKWRGPHNEQYTGQRNRRDTIACGTSVNWLWDYFCRKLYGVEKPHVWHFKPTNYVPTSLISSKYYQRKN